MDQQSDEKRLTEIVSDLNSYRQGIATPHELDVHDERLSAVVNNLAASALEGHRRIEEANRAVMAEIADKQARLIDAIAEFRDLVEGALSNNKIIEEALGQMHDTFKVHLPGNGRRP